MSAKTLMANESLLQEIETRVKHVRELGRQLVKGHANEQFSFASGLEDVREYDTSVQVLQEVASQLFAALDVVDPEDEEMQNREEEDESEEETAEDDDADEGEDEDDGEDE